MVATLEIPLISGGEALFRPPVTERLLVFGAFDLVPPDVYKEGLGGGG